MSMWTHESNNIHNQPPPMPPPKKSLIQKYQHWPNPFKNMVKDMKVWACEDTWQMEVSLWTTAALAFLWTNFVPSPIEIERKFLTGSYKCGFYMFGKTPSILDMVWGEPGAGKALLEMATPAAKALFAIWAVETTFDAMSTYQGVLTLQAMCDTDRYETLLRDAAAAMIPGVHQGAPVFASVIWDPHNHAVVNNNSVMISERSNVHMHAAGYVRSGTHVINSCLMHLVEGTTILTTVDIGHMEVNETRQYSSEFAGLLEAGAVGLLFEWDVAAGGLTNPEMTCTRLTVRQVPGDVEEKPRIDGPQTPPPMWNPCKQVQEFYDSMS